MISLVEQEIAYRGDYLLFSELSGNKRFSEKEKEIEKIRALDSSIYRFINFTISI